jgi:hypothetical protein
MQHGAVLRLAVSPMANQVFAAGDGAGDWPVAILAAFGGAALGAGLGGWFTRRERLRATRGRLYIDLCTFHDAANARRDSLKGGQPVGTGELGDTFRSLDRDAATASGFDSRAVRAIWPMLRRIDEVSGRYADRGEENARAAPLAARLVEEQREHWDCLVNYLWRYRRWLEWKATKPWWSLYRKVNRGPIGPVEEPSLPWRLR